LRSSSVCRKCEFVFRLPKYLRLSSILSLPAVILTKYSHFDTLTGVRWPAGWPNGAKRDIKANSAELKLELGLSLAIQHTSSIIIVYFANTQCFLGNMG
jgi:hypothetical protein